MGRQFPFVNFFIRIFRREKLIKVSVEDAFSVSNFGLPE
jgi:hypothetical protein